MTHDARSGIIEKDSGQLFVSCLGAITNDDHPRMLRVAHAHTAAVVQAIFAIILLDALFAMIFLELDL